jgi:hypothetical protein
MQAGRGLIHKVKGGLLHLADVELAVEVSSDAPHVVFTCSGRGFTSQGYFEDVPAVGYEHWKNGARVGATFALSIAGRPTAEVVVSRITGLSTDTNPTIVAVAAAHAVWNALGFAPPDEVVRALEARMFGSFGRGFDHVPDL